SCVLLGDESEGEFYSVALTHDYMQADTGTKMIHIGKNTRSRIISKGISTGHSKNIYRGMVKFMPSAVGARNYSQCDSMLVGAHSQAVTIPYIEVKNPKTIIEHEASTSRVSEEQLFYLQSRGLSQEQAISMVVHGFCREVFQHLPMEFSVEAVKLIEMKLENSVG
ncbi:MAG: SufD family Fe-S cluster assembly protein, partial [Bdellovibrionaceae bacterium]|nr:SufD family Fe-S cluster assembly protein [Pseudobdellovibrionaceae bacterium]